MQCKRLSNLKTLYRQLTPTRKLQIGYHEKIAAQFRVSLSNCHTRLICSSKLEIFSISFSSKKQEKRLSHCFNKKRRHNLLTC